MLTTSPDALGESATFRLLGLLAVVFFDHAGQHDGQHRAQRDEYRQHNQDRNAADGLLSLCSLREKRPGRSFSTCSAPSSFRILSAIYRCLLLSQITRPAISTSAGITITAMAAMVYISAVLLEAQGSCSSGSLPMMVTVSASPFIQRIAPSSRSVLPEML